MAQPAHADIEDTALMLDAINQVAETAPRTAGALAKLGYVPLLVAFWLG